MDAADSPVEDLVREPIEGNGIAFVEKSEEHRKIHSGHDGDVGALELESRARVAAAPADEVDEHDATASISSWSAPGLLPSFDTA
jgi:hypothetical protein